MFAPPRAGPGLRGSRSVTRPVLHVCVPTFRETPQLRCFLEAFARVDHAAVELYVVNADPGDASSDAIATQRRRGRPIREIAGEGREFWSATVNRGLRAIVAGAADGDWVAIANVDVSFEHDLFDRLLDEAAGLGDCQVGALATARGVALSSGVRVRSWFASRHVHPYAGRPVTAVPDGRLEAVDYLPGRCLVFPVAALGKAGFVAADRLPHYGADYEFSRRLARAGYPAYLSTAARLEADVSNTGVSSFARDDGLARRISRLMDMRNPANPRYRIVFVLLVYPRYAVPSGIVLYLLRSLLETLLGGARIRRLLAGPGRGFSR